MRGESLPLDSTKEDDDDAILDGKKLLTKICKNQSFGGNIDAFRFENVKDIINRTQRAQYGARQLITRIHNDL